LKLTQAAVKTLVLPPGKADAIFFDDEIPGFGLRMRAGSPRSEARWCVQYKIGSKHRRMTFGKLCELDAVKAREKAKDLLSAVRLGRDPAGEKLDARTKASQTFGPIIETFLERQESRTRPIHYKRVKRYLEGYCKPLHGLMLDKVTRADVAARLAIIAKMNGPVAADRCRSALGAFFTWAMREGLCEANPVIATNRHANEKGRDRVLTDIELTHIWKALPGDDFGRSVKLLILTGQRRMEIGALRWGEIDLDKRLISLPGERTKNYRPHDVPLSDLAIEVIAKCPRYDGRDMVFGSRGRGFLSWGKAKIKLDETPALLGLVDPWRIHDLRRTCVTRMADLGVQPHIIEAVINHVSGHKAGVAGIYNRATYATEKAAALSLWADHIKSLVRGAL
jgi:integrase